jgi:O-antigen/teichoic acid export membrane protein
MGDGDSQPGLMMEIDPSGQDVKHIAGGASLSLVGKVAGRGLSFITDVILARTLGASQFGLFSIGWTVFRILQMVIPLGFPQGVIRFVPEYKKQDKPELIKGLLSVRYDFGFYRYYLGNHSLPDCPRLSLSVFQKPELTIVFRLFSLFLPFCAILPISSAATRTTLNIKYSVLLEDIGNPGCHRFNRRRHSGYQIVC